MLFLIAATMAALTLIEMRGRPIQWRGRILNVSAWGLTQLATFGLVPLIALSVPFHLIDGTKLPFWIAFPIFLVATDLAEFLFHRAQHAVPFLWAMHSVHHSDDDLSATTTVRHFWLDQPLRSLTVWPAVWMVIQPTALMMVANATVVLWEYVCHSPFKFGFGQFSWILDSPAYHRIHHSREPRHYNSNFAPLFPIWDVVCGTYRRPDGWPETGLDERPQSIGELLYWPIRSAGKLRSAR